jgi:hypothetical protein
MLPWLALTYTAARLGFEAQNAAAFRLLRLGRGITKMAADEIVPEVPPTDAAQVPLAVAPKGVTPRRRFTENRRLFGSAASGLSDARATLPTWPTPSKRPSSSETAPPRVS